MFGIGNLEGMSPESHAMMVRVLGEEFKRTATVRAALPPGPQPVDRYFVSVPQVTAGGTLRIGELQAKRPTELSQGLEFGSVQLHAPELVEMLARRAGQSLGVADSKHLYSELCPAAGGGGSRVELKSASAEDDDAALRHAISQAVEELHGGQHYGPHVLLLKPQTLTRYRNVVNSKAGRGFVTDSLGADLKLALVPQDAAGEASLGALVSLGAGSVDVVAFDSVGLSVTAYGGQGQLMLLAHTRVALRVLDPRAIVEFVEPQQ